MPEIAEVARVVHFVRQHLVGRTFRKVKAFDDANVFGKAGCSARAVERALTGKRLVGAGQQGKYFWFEMSSPPHLLMHFSMAGWFHIKGMNTSYREAEQDKADQVDEKEKAWGEDVQDWPPKYVKFMIETDDGQEAAFVDFRRFARVRLVRCAADQMRKTSPLKENGPDPVLDKDLVTVDFLEELCARKKAPIKAVLLDQANISGIGNWVSDEVFYDAKMHPEQYANTLSKAQIKQLHKSIHYVCGLAVDVLADSTKFPDHWLFKWRWGKGKKDAAKVLPNGKRIHHITVGGRTSAIIPSVQKRTGAVAADVEDGDEEGDKKPAKKPASKKRKKGPVSEDEKEHEDEEKEKPAPKKSAPAGKGKSQTNQASKQGTKGAAAKETPKSKAKPKAVKKEDENESAGRRRSARISGAT